MFASKTTRGFYDSAIHGDNMPIDVVEITDEEHAALLDGQSRSKTIGWDDDGFPVLINPPVIPLTAADLCAQIDAAADAARRAVAGDPLRAVEYAKAAEQAAAFAEAGFNGEAPAMVAAWAIGGRTPQQAAENILAEAAQYNGALEYLRAVRLNAKDQVRSAMVAGEVEQAQIIASQTVVAIEAAVAGVGNNAN